MFGQEYPLFRHSLVDGYADEFLQTSPWSSGPMFFLGLKIYGSSGLLDRITWTEEEIEEML
jgi:hypothetical protein